MHLQLRTNSFAYRNLRGSRLESLTSERAADLKLKHDSTLKRVVDRLLCYTIGQSVVDGYLDDIKIRLHNTPDGCITASHVISNVSWLSG